MEIYFAYGANVNEEEMKRRCTSAQTISTGILGDYQIAFVFESDRWAGGVAGIRPKQGSRVEGVIYRISADDLQQLDKIENVHKKWYVRKKVDVRTRDVQTVKAYVYVPHPDSIKKKVRPSASYLENIIEGARKHGLSDGYIKWLENLLPKK